MPKQKKDILVLILAVAFVAVFVIMFLGSDLEHIEDTNGLDDFSLTTITDDDIISMKMGALNPAGVHRGKVDIGGVTISSGVKISSENFTGVHEVLYNNYILPSDFEVNLSGFTVESGNFRMVVVHEDEIVATIEPGLFAEYRLEDVTGRVSVRIAGESAAYTFYMSDFEYDQFQHG